MPTSLLFRPEQLLPAAERLAGKWGLSVGAPTNGGLSLLLTEEGLALVDTAQPKLAPLRIDFVGGEVAHRHRFGGGKGQTIARAVGLNKGRQPTIIDATAGLGRDAFVLASLGSPVTLIERSPVVAALLEDALERASGDSVAGPVVARMSLRSGDAVSLLPELAATDVVYLDPMFPKRTKSASVKKGMALLQRLHEGDGDDQSSLLRTALDSARERVVVKRPNSAPPLPGPPPTMAIKGKKHRFDVYVIKAMAGKLAPGD